MLQEELYSCTHMFVCQRLAWTVAFYPVITPLHSLTPLCRLALLMVCGHSHSCSMQRCVTASVHAPSFCDASWVP